MRHLSTWPDGNVPRWNLRASETGLRACADDTRVDADALRESRLCVARKGACAVRANSALTGARKKSSSSAASESKCDAAGARLRAAYM
eukprot:4406325-Pleurochrysis_carterae.AAC.1